MTRHAVAPRLVRALAGLGAALLVVTWSPASDATSATGRLYVVQAVPGATYTVAFDDRQPTDPAQVGVVLGPFELPAGAHDVTFTDESGGATTTTVRVGAGSSSDLVLHLPAARGGDPVADVYRAPMKAIAPGKARVLVAHTATVAPADVRVDGTTVFTNIANGEYAVADVAAGGHTAALVPTGTDGPALLGPLEMDLPAGTLTLVYAVGTPQNGSMDVITHQEGLDPDGSVAPRRIETGSAGLVKQLRVGPFGPS